MIDQSSLPAQEAADGTLRVRPVREGSASPGERARPHCPRVEVPHIPRRGGAGVYLANDTIAHARACDESDASRRHGGAYRRLRHGQQGRRLARRNGPAAPAAADGRRLCGGVPVWPRSAGLVLAGALLHPEYPPCRPAPYRGRPRLCVESGRICLGGVGAESGILPEPDARQRVHHRSQGAGAPGPRPRGAPASVRTQEVEADHGRVGRVAHGGDRR